MDFLNNVDGRTWVVVEMLSHLITLYLDRPGVQGDDEVEALSSARSPDKPEVSELGHALNNVRLVVAQLRPVVLVVPSSQAHKGAVLYVTQQYHLDAMRYNSIIKTTTVIL